jgi:hypothetical protein
VRLRKAMRARVVAARVVRSPLWPPAASSAAFKSRLRLIAVAAASPLGDTPEAHDELSLYDIPLYSPARRAAEQQAGGLAGTTRGHRHGGAAGRGGPAAGDDRLAGPDKKDGATV